MAETKDIKVEEQVKEMEQEVIIKEVIVEVPVEKIIEVEVEKIVEVPIEVVKEIAPKVNFKDAIEVAKSLALFNTEMENITKNASNPFFKSSYLDLSAISNTVRPLLAKHGLSVVQYPVDDENGRLSVTTVLLHSSGQNLEFPGIWVKLGKIGDIQGMASVITYLKRYSIAAILFVSGKDEDDDGEKAMGRGDNPSQQTAKSSTPPATQPNPRGTSLRGGRL